MFDLMQKDEDPRFKESKFLSFLSKLKNGDVKIVGDKLVELKQEESKDKSGEQIYEKKLQ